MRSAFATRCPASTPGHDPLPDRQPATRRDRSSTMGASPAAPRFGHQMGQVRVHAGPLIARQGGGGYPGLLPLEGMMDPLAPTGGYSGGGGFSEMPPTGGMMDPLAPGGGFGGMPAYPGLQPLPDLQPVPSNPFEGMRNPFSGLGDFFSGMMDWSSDPAPYVDLPRNAFRDPLSPGEGVADRVGDTVGGAGSLARILQDLENTAVPQHWNPEAGSVPGASGQGPGGGMDWLY